MATSCSRSTDAPVKETRDLIDYVSAQGPGETVTLEVLRDGKRMNREVKLERARAATRRRRAPSPAGARAASTGSASSTRT